MPVMKEPAVIPVPLTPIPILSTEVSATVTMLLVATVVELTEDVACTLRVIVVPPVEREVGSVICRKPWFTVVAPVYELLAPRMRVPSPVFVKPLPLSLTPPIR